MKLSPFAKAPCLDMGMWHTLVPRDFSLAEVHLWVHIKGRQINGLQFYRQRIIGNYIVDFLCPKAKLAIGVDGGQHYSDETITYDLQRDEYLKNQGFKVLRYSDTDVLTNIEGVIQNMLENLPLS